VPSYQAETAMHRFHALILLISAWGACPAIAQSGAPFPSEADIRSYVSRQIAISESGNYSRVEIQVGSAEIPGNRSTCNSTELMAPVGMRFWGRGHVTLRCTGGASWSISIPIVVRVWGNAWVAARSLPAGHTLMADDLQEAELELSRERPGLPPQTDSLIGKSLVRSLPAGQAVHADGVRTQPVLMAGDAVRLRVVGTGFSISASGQALGNAAEGQPVRVRTELGRTLLGTARVGRIVDIQP